MSGREKTWFSAEGRGREKREGAKNRPWSAKRARDLRNAETIMSIKPGGNGPSEPAAT